MNTKKINLFFFIFLSSFRLHAQTEISGDVSGVWSQNNSPYIVTADIHLAKNSSLLIEAGVEVKFKGHYEFLIEGLLKAEGTESDSIVFTQFYNSTDSTWKGLRFNYADENCYLKFCVIKNSGNGYWGRTRDGRGILCNYTNLTIENCIFRHNWAYYNGGGISFKYCSPTIISSHFINNRTIENRGGGMSFEGCHAKIIQCEFFKNWAPSGGGIYSENSSTYINKSTFDTNEAKWGCHINSEYDNLTVINSFFTTPLYSNRAFYLRGKTPIFNNCIIINENNPLANLIIGSSTVLQLKNCILINILFDQTENIDIQYSCIKGGWQGKGNIDAEPLFVDPENGDYHLQPASPCVDAGYPSVFYNDYDGSRNDMGIYGGSDIAVSPDVIDFGPLGQGQSKQDFFTICNFRETDFLIQNAEPVDTDNFIINTTFPLTVMPFNNDTITVEFQPQTSGVIESQIHLTSSDFKGADVADLDVRGVGGVFTGEVSGMWTRAYSPYYIGGNVTVPASETLTIEPGVTIYIDTTLTNTEIQFLVNGNLIAKGSENDSIIFIPKPGQERKGLWKGLVFNPDDDGYLENKFEMDYCRISYAETALELNTESPIIQHCTLSNNSLDGIMWKGLYEFYDEKNGQITNNHIYNNDRYGIYCQARCSRENGWAKPIIKQNIIENNSNGGIYLHADGNSSGSTNLFFRSSYAYLDAKIEQNNIINNSGFGIDCHSDGTFNTISGSIKHYSHSNLEPVITKNILVGNTNPFKLHSRTFEEYSLSHSNVVLENNVFYDNQGNQIFVSDSLSKILIHNNIIWNYNDNSLIIQDDAQVTAHYNCFQTAVNDTGNISSDPLRIPVKSATDSG